MELSKIKTEVEDSKDIKVKLEENLSSVVYEVKVTPKVEIKTEQKSQQQSLPTFVANEEVQSSVRSDHDPPNDELELEPESNNISTRESEIDSESDSDKEQRQQTLQDSRKSSKRSNAFKMKKSAAKIGKKREELLECTLCARSFPRVQLLIMHARKKHAAIKNPSSDPIIYDASETSSQCPLCSKSFTSVRNLPSHFLRYHVKNKPYQCSICLESTSEIKTFPTETILRYHLKTVHDSARYKFQCDLCSIKCLSSSLYKRHKDTHTKKKYKCEYCPKAYREKESMLRHIIAVHKEYTDRHETSKCDECDQLFCSQKDLDRHVLQTHATDTVQCKTCSKKFREEGELSKHLEVSHREIRTCLVCDVCSEVFKNNQDLVQHLEVQHKRFFKCRKCFRSFVSEEDYDSHSAQALKHKGRNAKKTQFQCKVCLVFLKTECSFSIHKDTHLKPSEIERKIISQDCVMKCDFCRNTFVQKSLLLDHARKCHPNRKLECKYCKKSFQVKFQLNKHEWLHSTNKLFECHVCHKGFAYLHNLQQHEGIHKIDKKYKCSQCEKSFAVNTNLKRHIANHHGGAKPFKCDICKKAFVFKGLLVKHSQVHTNKKPFSCSKCSYSFKYAYNLTSHEQTIHSESRVRGGPRLKYFENFVYICSVEECGFETKDEKEVAIHYAKHKLPKVILPRLLHGPSCEVFLSNSTTVNKHAIQARYKCTQCFKDFSLPGSLTRHTRMHHNGKQTKPKKGIQNSSSSDEDET